MANVLGKFYSGVKLRKGVTPESPTELIGVQPYPLNPPGSGGGDISPVSLRYADTASMLADQNNQKSGFLYFDGTDTYWYLGVPTGTIADYEAFGGGSSLPPIDGSYADQATMIADQSNQTAQYIYYDSTEYWEYLGTVLGTIADYRAFASGGGSGISGLTANRITKATSATTIGNSGITEESGISYLFGNRTALSTLTPLAISLGGTFGNNAVGSSENLKLKVYDDGSSVSGIGISLNLMEFRSGAGAAIGFFPNAGSDGIRMIHTVSATRVDINHASNSGFRLSIAGVNQWSIATYGTNKDYTIFNDIRARISQFTFGLTNNTTFCDNTFFSPPSDAGFRLDVAGTFRSQGNGIFGNKTSTATSSPINVSFGGTYGTSAAGSVANMKWFLYQDATPANSYGIGMTAGLMELRAGSGASIGFFPNNGVESFRVLSSGNLKFIDAKNFEFGTSTGTKFGTSTLQKLSFWNKTPIIQPTTAIAAASFVANTSGIANDTATFDGYTIGQVVSALRNTGLLA